MNSLVVISLSFGNTAVALVLLVISPSGILMRRISAPFRYTTAPPRTFTLMSSRENVLSVPSVNLV